MKTQGATEIQLFAKTTSSWVGKPVVKTTPMPAPMSETQTKTPGDFLRWVDQGAYTAAGLYGASASGDAPIHEEEEEEEETKDVRNERNVTPPPLTLLLQAGVGQPLRPGPPRGSALPLGAAHTCSTRKLHLCLQSYGHELDQS